MDIPPYLLAPWCRVLLEKLTGLQLVKKFPAFHGTRKLITTYKRLKLSDIVNTTYRLHVSATVVAILREVRYKEYITKVLYQCTKCKILSFTVWFKMYNNI